MQIHSADSMRMFQSKFSCAATIFLIVTATAIHSASAHEGDDQRPLTHEDYDRWNTISGVQLSNNGQWLMYTLQDGTEQRTLVLRDTTSSREYRILRGKEGRFSFDSKFAAYRIGVDEELVKKLKQEEKNESQLPKEQFELLDLTTGEHWATEGVKSFAMPREMGNWLAFLLDEPDQSKTVTEETSEITERYEVTPQGLKRQEPSAATEPQSEPHEEPTAEPAAGKQQSSEKRPNKKAKRSKQHDDDDEEKKKKPGTTLVLRHLTTGVERRYPHVVRYRFGKHGKRLAIATSTEDDPEKDGVHVIDLQRNDRKQIIRGEGNYKQLTFSEDESRLAWITDRDDYKSEHRSWSLYLWKSRQKEAAQVAAAGSEGIPEGWWVPESASVMFAENGKRLFFSTAPISEEALEEDAEHQNSENDQADEGDKDEDEEEKAKLDLWHWKEPLIQPQQLLQAEQERQRSYRAAYDLRARRIVQLATEEIRDKRIDPRRDADITVGFSEKKYQRFLSWDFPVSRDVYLIDINHEGKRLLSF